MKGHLANLGSAVPTDQMYCISVLRDFVITSSLHYISAEAELPLVVDVLHAVKKLCNLDIVS